MKRTLRNVLLVLLLLLLVPAGNAAMAVGLGPAGSATVAAAVYAQVNHAACGSGYQSGATGSSGFYVCATADDAALAYSGSDSSAGRPALSHGSNLYLYTFTYDVVSQAYRSSAYYGSIPTAAFTVAPLIDGATLKTTLTMQDGSLCAVDLQWTTPNGPAVGEWRSDGADPSHPVSLSIWSWMDAAAWNVGTVSGTVCGMALPSADYAIVARGAQLRADVNRRPPADNSGY